MKKLKTNIRYFMQLRQSPSMVFYLQKNEPLSFPAGPTQKEPLPSPFPMGGSAWSALPSQPVDEEGDW